jgi:hypothetical protein
MTTKATFVIIGLAATLALMVAPTLSSNAHAKTPNDKFSTDCEGPGKSSKEGDCPGGSERSGPHDEAVTNPGGNQPPGLQEDDD